MTTNTSAEVTVN